MVFGLKNDAHLQGAVWGPVSIIGLKGNKTVAALNAAAASASLGDAYVATDAGTPTAGDLLAVGDIAEFRGVWKKAVSNIGGFPPLGTFALAASAGLIAPLTSSSDEGGRVIYGGTSLAGEVLPAPSTGQEVTVGPASAAANTRLAFTAGGAGQGVWSNVLAAGEGIDVTARTITASPTADDPWSVQPVDIYTNTPPTTSTITMSATAGFVVGKPVRYEQTGTKGYGVITAVTTDSEITIAGAALDTGNDIDELAIAPVSHIVNAQPFVLSTYADAAETDLLAVDMHQPMCWDFGAAYLVKIEVSHHTVDATTQPEVGVSLDGSQVMTENTNTGPTLSGTADTFTASSAVGINTTNYRIENGEFVEITTTAAGTGDAADLTCKMVFVLA